MDILLITLLTLATIPLALFASGPPRVVVGVLFLLLIPGYALVAALFPRKNSIDAIERLALSTGMSIALAALTGLVLNYTPWGIHLGPVLISLTSLTLLFCVAAVIRRARLPRDEMPGPQPGQRTGVGRAGGGNRFYPLVLLALVLIGFAAVVYAAVTLRAGEKFTEFYALGTEGTAANYPSKLQLGQTAEVTLGVANHERQDASYRLEIRIGGEIVRTMDPINLADGEKWEGKVSFEPKSAGQEQRVDLWLYKAQETKFYRELHFSLDVGEAE